MVREHKLYVPEKNRVKKELLTKRNVLLKSYKLHQSRPQVWLQAFWQSTSRRNPSQKRTVFLGVAYLTSIPYIITSHIHKFKTIFRPINLGLFYNLTFEP